MVQRLQTVHIAKTFLGRLAARIDWIFVAAAALALPILLLTPILSGQLPGTHDAQLHLARLVNAALNIREGIIWPRWGPHLYSAFGYPLGNFYAPGWHILGGFLVAAGVPAVPVWLLAQAIGIVLYPTGAYLFGRLVAGRPGALLGAAVFVYAPFRFYELFGQGNVSQFIAMGLMPWVLWALARSALVPRPSRVATAALLFAALIVTHHPTAFLFVPVAGLYTLLVAWAAPHDESTPRRNRFIATLAAYGIGLLLSAVYWLPAGLESKYVQLDLATAQYQIAENFSPLSELLGPNLFMDRAALNPPRALNAGQPQLILAAAGLIVALWPRSRLTRWQRVHAIAGGVAIIAGLYLVTYYSLWLWQISPLTKLILFPWRFLGVVSVATIPGAAIALESLRKRWQPYALIVGLVVIIGTALPAMVPTYDNVPGLENVTPGSNIRYEVASGNFGGVATNEYTPIWVKERPLFDPCATCYDNWQWQIRYDREHIPANVTVESSHGVHRSGTRFDIHAPDAFLFRLHQFYFPGWKITLDGVETDITITDPQGLMAINVPAGNHSAEAWYAGTDAQHAGDTISLAALVLCVGLIVFDLRVSRSKRMVHEPFLLDDVNHPYPRLGTGIAAATLVFAVINTAIIVPKTDWLRPSGTPSQPLNVWQPEAAIYADSQGTPQMELVGIDLSQVSGGHGDWVYARLYWHALRKLDFGWRVALKLSDVTSQTDWANSDNAIPGGYPTSDWPLDRYVVDAHILRISQDTPPYLGKLNIIVYNDKGATLQISGGSLILPHFRVIASSCDAPPANATAAQVRFGDAVSLRAYTLTNTAGHVSLDLYWTVQQAPPTEYSLSLHFMQAGKLLDAPDRPPLDSYPSPAWTAGQCLHGQYELDSPPGADRLLVGFYDRATTIPLPATAQGNAQIEANGLFIPLK